LGLLDYYRQFEALSEAEVNRELREQAQERKSRELARVETLDLSQTVWPELPHPNVANAITFVARRGLQRYPAPRAQELRNELSHRHEISPVRVAIGHGAAQLLSAATAALMRPEQELVTPWPSYPLFPIMASRAHGSAVPARAHSVTGWVDAVLAAVGERTRIVALASPNDPTGERLPVDELRRLLSALPPEVAILLDEALVELADGRELDASLPLLEEHPRLLVFRSFSKAWGLAGLRVGYALGGPGSEDLLGQIEPDFGIGELAQAGALEALHSTAELLPRRARSVALERERLLEGLRARGFEASESEVNFVWVRHPSMSGDELTDRLARVGVLVASGAGLGEPGWVRIAVQRTLATDRLLEALDKIF
jgi:histidinol-phosphate aminotransferase